MAEEANAPEAEGGPDPVAMGIALGRASRAVDAELIAYLHEQRHHLHVQLLPALWEKWLGVFLRVTTACVGLAFAGGVGFLVWQAAHSDGLKVEPFSVPPAMAERGLTGQVVAARVIDRLSELQEKTNTARPARSYSNAWGEQAIKLEIPETGVSLAELDSWLRENFGHETAMTGEVVRNGDSVTLTARAGEEGAVSVSGPEADMDALTDRLAEAIYRLTQTYRYATYLLRHENRAADAAPIFKALALHGSPEDKRWSYNMWAVAVSAAEGNTETGLRMFQQAHDADPAARNVYPNLALAFEMLGRDEEALRTVREWLSRLPPGESPARVNVRAFTARIRGAFQDALPAEAANARTGIAGINSDNLSRVVIADQQGEHDLAAARTNVAGYQDPHGHKLLGLLIAVQSEDWKQGLGLGDAMAAYLHDNPHDRLFAHVNYAQPLALAQAHLGDFSAAEKTIAPTPGNCLRCVIARAQIAELQGQRARAAWWFNRAGAISPSLPFAFEAQGRALLGRGEPDAAIACFTIANQKTPHFADALEGWGEALMAKNQSHLALAKFEDAEKYAPNWGRLHLKWGEALVYAGKADEAMAQFARAAQLGLTPSEKVELARQTPHA